MALPKEPRQKMINIMYLVLTAILALNVSAEVIEAFKTVDKSLGNSNTNLGNSTNTTFKSLNDKQAEAKTAEQAKIWYPKADQAVQLTKGLDTYINGLKDQLKTAAGATATNPSFKEDNLDASTRLFETNGLGKQLEQKLKDYKTAMLAIDPKISAEFANNFPVNTDGVGSKDFTTSYFHMTPTVAALTMLSKFQNNIKNAENQVVSFAHSQVGAVEYVYDQFKTIIGTSSTYLMPGEEMEVTAGIGSFSKSAAPTVTINGVSQSANADGVAIRKFPVSGSGTVHVVVTYTKPDGTKGTDTKDIPYTVGVPGGAAVMLDKMNVFYIGLENPITIGSPKGWDKTNVSMSGGTLSGSGSKRTVTVTTPGTASITVAAEGSAPTTFPYRVLRVPDPVFKIGDGKPRQPTVSIKNQQYVRAELENFVYDTRYSVTGAKIFFSGAGFPSPIPASISGNSLGSVANLLQRCVPGSTVTFESITVTGPGGSRTIDGRSFTCY